MARRRMFSVEVTDSDDFLDLPLHTQALYFHLSMHADDDGFINSAKRLVRGIGASESDLEQLVSSGFLIRFPSCYAVTHWKVNNYIQSDRYSPTGFQEEYETLVSEKGKPYRLKEEAKLTDTQRIQPVSKTDTQYSIGKDSVGKKREEKNSPVERGAGGTENVADHLISEMSRRYGTHYEVTPEIQQLIHERLSEGHTQDELETAIRKGTDAPCPQLLFGDRFEEFLGRDWGEVLRQRKEQP